MIHRKLWKNEEFSLGKGTGPSSGTRKNVGDLLRHFWLSSNRTWMTISILSVMAYEVMLCYNVAIRISAMISSSFQVLGLEWYCQLWTFRISVTGSSGLRMLLRMGSWPSQIILSDLRALLVMAMLSFSKRCDNFMSLFLFCYFVCGYFSPFSFVFFNFLETW